MLNNVFHFSFYISRVTPCKGGGAWLGFLWRGLLSGRPEACLPTPSFRDNAIKATLAGYGQFYRRDMSDEDKQRCQTDEYGRNKFHMCRDLGRGEAVCHMDKPPPRNRACAAFFAATKMKYPEEYEEVQLVDEGSGNSTFCFADASPKAQSRGWCETDENYYGYKEVQ